jgi:hypothetical protein
LECERQLELLNRKDDIVKQLKDIEDKLKNLPDERQEHNSGDESTGASDPPNTQPDKLINSIMFDTLSSDDVSKESS